MGFLDTLSDVTGWGSIGRKFLHPENAYRGAADEARQGFQRAEQYERPIFLQGQNEIAHLQDAIQQLMNPEGLYNRFSSGYETSPYAKRMLELNKESGLDAASSMGLMGSSGALRNIQLGAGDIVAAERQKYLENLMNTYLKGIGLSHDIYNTGANAATNLAGGGRREAENLTGLRYGEEAAPGQLISNLLRTGAQAYGASHGGGFLS